MMLREEGRVRHTVKVESEKGSISLEGLAEEREGGEGEGSISGVEGETREWREGEKREGKGEEEEA